MKIKLKLLFTLASLLLETSNLYAMWRVTKPVNFDQENYVTKRKMFFLTPDYRDANQILMIKGVSSVIEFAERPIVVTKLIDGSEIPFYQSTGINSGLPKVWLPFFGLWEDGWFHKNKTFDTDNVNPLYHSGCYVLAQVANELDRLLSVAKPNPSFNTLTPQALAINYINCWIGGKLLDLRNMPQEMGKAKNIPLAQHSPISTEGVAEYNVVDTTTTVSKNLFGFLKNEQERKKDVVACDNYFFSSLTTTHNSYLTQNPFVKPSFLKETKNTALFVHDLKELMQRMEKFHSNEGSPYVKEYKAFKELVGITLSLDVTAKSPKSAQDKSKAYLALQMLKRFSFNYVYKMLNEIAKNPRYSEEFYNRALVPSRAVWVMIKHNRKFGDYKKNDLYRKKFLEIEKNAPVYFNILCMEKPVQIIRFLKEENYDTDDTELEEHIANQDLLKKIRIKVSQIYETPEYELTNIHRVIEKDYHKKSFAEIVGHYNQPDHLLEIEGVTHDKDLEIVEKNLEESLEITKLLRQLDNESSRQPRLRDVLQKTRATSYIILSRLVIPDMLNKLQQLNLDNYKNYIDALDGLLFLKNIFQGSDAPQPEKDRAHLSIAQITTVLYMDALAKIPTFQKRQ